MGFDLYKILGVKKNSSKKDIKKAYKKKAKETHPDMNEGRRSEEFGDITKAYSILISDEKRKKYDETGETESPINTKESSAIQQLAMIFMTLLNREKDAIFTDYKKLIKQEIKNRIAHEKDQIEKMGKDIEFLNEVVSRIKVKEKSSFLRETVLGNIRDIEKTKVNTKRILEINNIMIKLIKTFSYKYERNEENGGLDFSDSYGNMPPAFVIKMGL